MKIKDLSESERPRERLLSSGPQALSNGELLAVLLRSGTQSANVLDVARSLLRSCEGRLVRLSQMDGSELTQTLAHAASACSLRLLDEPHAAVSTSFAQRKWFYRREKRQKLAGRAKKQRFGEKNAKISPESAISGE